MTVHLSDVWSALGGIAALVAILAGIFAGLRWIIRAETAELRHNGGNSIKDVVHRLDVRLEATESKVDRIDQRSEVTETKLDEHIADSKQRIEAGAGVEAELREAISHIAEALPTIAASTPPEQQH